MPACVRCASKSVKCLVLAGHPKCSECTRAGRACVRGEFSASAFTRMSQEADRLVQEEELVEEQLSVLNARLARLRKQKKSLRERSLEMARRGFESIDEMEEADRREAAQVRGAEEARAAEAAAAEEPRAVPEGGFAWSPVEFSGLDPELLLEVGPDPSSGSGS